MDICCWVHAWGERYRRAQEDLTEGLGRQGVKAEPFDRETPSRPGVCVVSETSPELRDFLQTVSRAGKERVIAITCLIGSVGLDPRLFLTS